MFQVFFQYLQQEGNWLAKLLELYFFVRKISTRWSNQAGKIVLKTCQFTQCLATNLQVHVVAIKSPSYRMRPQAFANIASSCHFLIGSTMLMKVAHDNSMPSEVISDTTQVEQLPTLLFLLVKYFKIASVAIPMTILAVYFQRHLHCITLIKVAQHNIHLWNSCSQEMT